jgi:hypothetical protein
VVGAVFLVVPNPSALSLAASPGEVLRMAAELAGCGCGWPGCSEALAEEDEEDGLGMFCFDEGDVVKGK